jgi:flagellar protein FliS
MHNATQAYRHVERECLVEGGDKLGTVRFLYEELKSSINNAVSAINLQDIENKSKSISKAVCIVYALQSALDTTKGGEIAVNLFRLYDWIRTCLITSIRNQSTEQLEAAYTVVNNLADAWQNLKK